MIEQTTFINNAGWQIIVGVWMLYVVSTLFYFYFKHKRVKTLMKEMEEIKADQREMFKNIIETFEFIASDRNKIIKEIDDIRKRIRLHNHGIKKQISQKTFTKEKRSL